VTQLYQTNRSRDNPTKKQTLRSAFDLVSQTNKLDSVTPRSCNYLSTLNVSKQL